MQKCVSIRATLRLLAKNYQPMRLPEQKEGSVQSAVRDSLLSLIETASGTNKLTDTACARAGESGRKRTEKQ